MKLSDLFFLQAAARFIRAAKWPLIVTLVLSYPAAIADDTWSKVFMSAISGQLAITLIKLCFYVGLFLLAFAFALRKWPTIFSPIHRIGDIIAGIGFEMSGIAAGVVLGIFSGLAVEYPLPKALLTSSYLAFIFVAISVLLWVAAVAHKEIVPASEIWKGISLSVVAILLASLAGTSLYCETWPEIDGLKLERNEHICNVFHKL